MKKTELIEKKDHNKCVPTYDDKMIVGDWDFEQDENKMVLHVDTWSDSAHIEIDFCPFCGEKL